MQLMCERQSDRTWTHMVPVGLSRKMDQQDDNSVNNQYQPRAIYCRVGTKPVTLYLQHYIFSHCLTFRIPYLFVLPPHLFNVPRNRSAVLASPAEVRGETPYDRALAIQSCPAGTDQISLSQFVCRFSSHCPSVRSDEISCESIYTSATKYSF
jgi:hypothetical protein